MYYDLGLKDWIFEIEQTSRTQIADQVMEIVNNFDGSLENVRLLNERVKAIYEENMQILSEYLTKN